MTFFEDTRGIIRPISQIDSICPIPRQEGTKFQYLTHRIYLTDGDGSLEVPSSTVDYIRAAGQTVIPAEPGTELLTFWRDDEQANGVFSEPVLAWRIDGSFRGAEPVVLDFNFDTMAIHHAILHPSGRVLGAGGEVWAGVEEWRLFQVRDAEEELKRKATEQADA